MRRDRAVVDDAPALRVLVAHHPDRLARNEEGAVEVDVDDVEPGAHLDIAESGGGAEPPCIVEHEVDAATLLADAHEHLAHIACGQIDIGNTATDMTARMSTGSLQANGTIMPEPTFDVQHVVDGIVYMAGLPLDANVQFMTVMATSMPFIGRG
jgi:hypothetical protein